MGVRIHTADYPCRGLREKLSKNRFTHTSMLCHQPLSVNCIAHLREYEGAIASLAPALRQAISAPIYTLDQVQLFGSAARVFGWPSAGG